MSGPTLDPLDGVIAGENEIAARTERDLALEAELTSATLLGARAALAGARVALYAALPVLAAFAPEIDAAFSAIGDTFAASVATGHLTAPHPAVATLAASIGAATQQALAPVIAGALGKLGLGQYTGLAESALGGLVVSAAEAGIAKVVGA